MAKRLNLPDDLHDQFQQLLKLAPDELQNNVDIQNTLSVYLKFGGEKLARHGLGIINKRYLEEKWQRAQESKVIDTEDSEIDASEDSEIDASEDSETDASEDSEIDASEDSEIDASEDLQDDDTSYSESDDLKDDDPDDSPPAL
jgi:hypothetical protein